MSQAVPAAAAANGHANDDDDDDLQPIEEERGDRPNGICADGPAANAQTDAFMELGGKGDQQLFENDRSSRYEPDEVPNPQ